MGVALVFGVVGVGKESRHCGVMERWQILLMFGRHVCEQSVCESEIAR